MGHDWLIIQWCWKLTHKSSRPDPTTFSLKMCNIRRWIFSRSCHSYYSTSFIFRSVQIQFKICWRAILFAENWGYLEKDQCTNDWKSIRYTYNHIDKPDFHKTFVPFYIGNSGTPLPYIFVQYYIDHEGHLRTFTKLHSKSKNLEKTIQHTKHSVHNQIKNPANKDIKDILKAFDDFRKKGKNVWINVFWYIKVYISWKFVQYTIHWGKTQFLKKISSDETNVTKNVFFFLSRAPTHPSFTFKLRFFYELKHKVRHSKSVCGIFHFRPLFVFMKVKYFFQQAEWTLWF